MLDFEVQRCTRRCAKTDRELRPGEVFYSVLVPEQAQVVRYDYAEQTWEGPPDGAIGWWKSRMPEPHSNKLHWAPSDVMLHYFEELEGRPDRQDERYILALLLLRRRIARAEETDSDDAGRTVMVLYCPKKEKQYRVPVVMPTADRIREIQEGLARLLFADAAT
jgi:hypothetical protein